MTPQIADIMQVVARHYKLPIVTMINHTRASTMPRQLAMYLCTVLTERSLTEIGRRFGGRDHTTVTHAWNVMPDRIAADPTLATAVEQIKAKIALKMARSCEDGLVLSAALPEIERPRRVIDQDNYAAGPDRGRQVEEALQRDQCAALLRRHLETGAHWITDPVRYRETCASVGLAA